MMRAVYIVMSKGRQKMQTIGARVQARGFWPEVIVLGALLPRLVLWSISQHPGLWDPIEYYSLAVNLHAGRGFTLDYIWSFANDPQAVTHPLDHWLPLPGVLAAGSFAVFGVSVRAALLPFVLLGVLQSLLVYGFAGRIRLSRDVRVFAALATAWTPWLFLSSLHTDTTTLFGVLGFASLATVYLGVTENGRWRWVAGALVGLAMLTRNDGVMLIPAGLLGGAWIAWRTSAAAWGAASNRRGDRAAGGAAALAVTQPVRAGDALARQHRTGVFVTDHEDFYAYSKAISLNTYLDQGLAQITGKIVFELAASVKLMITLVELIFPVAIQAGLLEGVWGWSAARDGRRSPEPDLLPFVPALCSSP